MPTYTDPLITGFAESSAIKIGRLVGAVPLQTASAKDTASGEASGRPSRPTLSGNPAVGPIIPQKSPSRIHEGQHVCVYRQVKASTSASAS